MLRACAAVLVALQGAQALVTPRGALGAPRGLSLRSVPPPETSESPATVDGDAEVDLSPAEKELTEKQKEIARLRAAEKFIKKETGTHICRTCNYKYEPAAAGGVPFAELPAGWRCPTCRSQKGSFEPLTITIAGFAENQSFGLGGNNMSESDKNLLIFGSLFGFFLIFMSGYLLT